jgi:hypothetical protein
MGNRRKSFLDRVPERPLAQSPLFWFAVAASVVFVAFFNWALVTVFSS